MTLLQKIETALILSLISACGCHSLTPAQQARADKFDCQVAALAPALDGVLDAYAFVKNVYEGAAQYGQLVPLLQLAPAEVAEIEARLRACEPAAEAPLPAGEPQ